MPFTPGHSSNFHHLLPAIRSSSRALETVQISSKVIRYYFMRILEMVKCGCRAAGPDDVTLATRPVQEVPLAGTGRYRGNRHRRVGPGKMSSGHWRPSLGDIVEDALDQTRKCGSAAGNSAKPRVRGEPKLRKEDFRQMEASSTMSGYAPTAFLF